MKWRDHARITAGVCRHFGLENCREIAQASVLPDKDPDYYWASGRRRVPHHEQLAIEYAFKHLERARRLFLMNKPFHEALGRAF